MKNGKHGDQKPAYCEEERECILFYYVYIFKFHFQLHQKDFFNLKFIPINEFPCNLFLPLAFPSSGWQLTTLKIKLEYARTAKYFGKKERVFSYWVKALFGSSEHILKVPIYFYSKVLILE